MARLKKCVSVSKTGSGLVSKVAKIRARPPPQPKKLVVIIHASDDEDESSENGQDDRYNACAACATILPAASFNSSEGLCPRCAM